MNLSSHLLQRRLRLPSPLTSDLIVERDLRVPMHDGVDLLADRWLPALNQADIAAIGRRSDYFQDSLAYDAQTPRWASIDNSHRVADIAVPVSSIGGWYDIFLPGQLRDFQTLQAAGRAARLTIGPWSHTSVDVDQPHERGSDLVREGPIVADSVLLQTRPPHSRSSVQRRIPALQPKSGQRRTQGDGRNASPRRSGGVPRPGVPVRSDLAGKGGVMKGKTE
jgi:predicted acyl esterase